MATTEEVTLASDAEILRRVSLNNILDEILVRLRNNITDRRDRTTYVTETFTGDASTTTFELTEDLDSRDRHKVMNIKTLSVAGVAKTYMTDFYVGYRKDDEMLGKIQFWNAPANAASISVYYGHTYHFIYPEEPRIDLTSNHYPRISVQIKSKPEEAACGGKATKYVITVPIIVIDTKREYVEKTIQEIKDYFLPKTNRTSFVSFRYVFVSDVSEVARTTEDVNDIRYGQKLELSIPFEYEFSN